VVDVIEFATLARRAERYAFARAAPEAQRRGDLRRPGRRYDLPVPHWCRRRFRSWQPGHARRPHHGAGDPSSP